MFNDQDILTAFGLDNVPKAESGIESNPIAQTCSSPMYVGIYGWVKLITSLYYKSREKKSPRPFI